MPLKRLMAAGSRLSRSCRRSSPQSTGAGRWRLEAASASRQSRRAAQPQAVGQAAYLPLVTRE
ncbi:MAG: hypothetical protein MUO30_01230 [Anaerolineales bacterium]|nr:hypothetical protein [Anaerolineales bacterium]